MLKMIINTSSNENSLVLDCFSGSGSTLFAAASMRRKWIGIDESEKAINIFKKRFDKLDPNMFQEYYDYIYLEQV